MVSDYSTWRWFGFHMNNGLMSKLHLLTHPDYSMFKKIAPAEYSDGLPSL